MHKFAAFADLAGELLEKADKRAGEVTEKVKERAGLPTPSRRPEDDDEGVFVPVSSAAASLLDEAERDMWLRQPGRPEPDAEAGAEALPVAGESAEEGGGASSQAEGGPAEAAEGDEWVQQRKARRGEWVALQQELQILTMHGRKLQARLTAVAAQLAGSRQAEQLLRRQLQESEGGRRAAEEPRREAELRARRAEEALGGEGAQGERLRAELAAAVEEAARARAALALQEQSLAAARQEQLSDERAARGVAAALGERLQATEAREKALRRSEQAGRS